MFDGIDGINPAQMEMQLPVDPFVIKLESAGFKFMISPSGMDGEMRILFIHPIFPVRFDIPFDHFVLMERFSNDVARWVERAKDAQETSA